MFGLGLAGALGGTMKIMAPAYEKGHLWQLRRPQEFNVAKMSWIAGGLIGWGRVNRKHYGQFLWIAFPVADASVEELPPSPPPEAVRRTPTRTIPRPEPRPSKAVEQRRPRTRDKRSSSEWADIESLTDDLYGGRKDG